MTGWQMAMELYHRHQTMDRTPLVDEPLRAPSELQKSFDERAGEWRRLRAEGKSIREIARRAGCSQKTVKRRL